MKKALVFLCLMLALCFTAETLLPGTALAEGAKVLATEASAETPEKEIKTETVKGNATTYTIYNGSQLQLYVNTSKKIKWSSNKKTVATVSSSGLVTAKKVGTATITAKYNGKTKKFTIKVKSVLEASTKSPSMKAGESKDVVFTFHDYGYLTYKIANTSIVSATWGSWYDGGTKIKLTLTGLKKGSTKVTVTNSATSDKITLNVKVKSGGSTGSGNCYALLIGEQHFLGYNQSEGYYYKETANRNANDAANMQTMLGRVKGPNGGSYNVTKKIDLDYAGIRSNIQSIASKAKSSDVMLFFIATHGDSSADGELIMPFTGNSMADVEEYIYGHNYLPFDTLAYWLNQFPGKVQVIIQSCGAGSAVYDPYEQNKTFRANGKGGTLSSGHNDEAFVNKATSAFKFADKGIKVESNTGELRVENKFYVLAASRHREESWGYEGPGASNLFTNWVIKGVGYSGSSPADTNGDRKLTVEELFKYTKRMGEENPIPYEGKYYYQHSQRYPAGSTYTMFQFK